MAVCLRANIMEKAEQKIGTAVLGCIPLCHRMRFPWVHIREGMLSCSNIFWSQALQRVIIRSFTSTAKKQGTNEIPIVTAQ